MRLNWMSGQVVKHNKQSDKAHGPNLNYWFFTILFSFSLIYVRKYFKQRLWKYTTDSLPSKLVDSAKEGHCQSCVSV